MTPDADSSGLFRGGTEIKMGQFLPHNLDFSNELPV